MDLIHAAQERLAHSGEALSEFDFRGRDEKAQICSDDDVENDEQLGSLWTGHGPQHEKTLRGRDLLSLLSACYCHTPALAQLICCAFSSVKSNMATRDKERMSQSEILSQISTFMAAGHETTS
jgi:hypothetical protein